MGLALSDPLKMLASPYKQIPFTNQEDIIETICSIVSENNVEKVIIGFPVREDGKEGEGCEDARQFLNALQKRDISALLWDERYSSKIAEGILRESGVKAKNQKDKLDALAASVLLENYLAFIKYQENQEASI
ncbi:MAG: Holliday junction resolvase RuvX [Spirochaetales bacterium]|nr:Holliday junction resolvase RuvX [Spirochaetales bacterium]